MSSLDISAWNVQGHLDVKLRDDEFVSQLTSDFVCLTETWCKYESVNNLYIPDQYTHVYSCRQSCGRTESGGGVSLLYKKQLKHISPNTASIGRDTFVEPL
jgi:exonuclease III